MHVCVCVCAHLHSLVVFVVSLDLIERGDCSVQIHTLEPTCVCMSVSVSVCACPVFFCLICLCPVLVMEARTLQKKRLCEGCLREKRVCEGKEGV